MSSQTGRRTLMKTGPTSFPDNHKSERYTTNDISTSTNDSNRKEAKSARKAHPLPSGPNKRVRVSPSAAAGNHNHNHPITPPRKLDLSNVKRQEMADFAEMAEQLYAELELDTISEQAESLSSEIEGYDCALAMSNPTARVPRAVANYIMNIVTHFKLLPATKYLAIEIAGTS
jgi:hypothetical protein